MRGFQQRYAELQALSARVAGISGDTWATQGVFCEQNALEFPVLSDWPEYKTMESFGVKRETGPTARRVTFVFDASGVCRHMVTEERDMEAHPAGALAAVQALAAGRDPAASAVSAPSS